MRRHVMVLVLAAVVTVTSACGGETTGSPGTGSTGHAVVETSVDPSAGDPTTTVEPASTTASTAIPVVGEVIVVDTVETAGFPGTRILGHGDQFVRLTTADGQLVMSSSDDGVNWEPVVSGLALDGVWVAASDGSLLHVGGWSVGRSGFVIATSADDGATWTTSELPVSDPGLPYVQARPYVAAVAAGEGTAVAVGTVNNDVDWQTYSIEQLGVDHGQMDSMGSADGGAPGQLTVRFADGFELTVDAAEFGLDSMFAGAGPVTVAWVWDGTAWERISPPFGSILRPADDRLRTRRLRRARLADRIGRGPGRASRVPLPRRTNLAGHAPAGHLVLRPAVARRRSARLRPRRQCRPVPLHRCDHLDRGAPLRRPRSPVDRVHLAVRRGRRPDRVPRPHRPARTGARPPAVRPVITRRRDLGRDRHAGRHPQHVRRPRQPIRRRHPRDHRPINGHAAGRLPRRRITRTRRSSTTSPRRARSSPSARPSASPTASSPCSAAHGCKSSGSGRPRGTSSATR